MEKLKVEMKELEGIKSSGVRGEEPEILNEKECVSRNNH
jgi:hypothetical protein